MSDYIQIAETRGNILSNKEYIQLAVIRGTPDRSKNGKEMLLDDFYTLCMKEPKNNIGLRKKNKQHNLTTFYSKDVSIDYLCSDFVRFCLSLAKGSSFVSKGEISLIPKHPIPVSDELKEYIEEFLPDFYGIRK